MCKRLLPTLVFLFLSCSLFAQPFVPDKNGYVADPKFHKLIKERGYELVGHFITLETKTISITVAQILKNGQIGYINNNGTEMTRDEIFPPPAQSSTPASKKHFSLFSNNGKYGIKDQFGNIAIQAKYDDIKICQDSNAYAKLGNRTHTFRLDAENVFEYDYESLFLKYQPKKDFTCISVFPELFVAKSNGKFALFNSEGKTLTPFIYDHIIWYSKLGIGRIEIGLYPQVKEGLIDSAGKVFLQPVYYGIREYLDGHVFVLPKRDSNKVAMGIYNKLSNFTSPIIYNDISDFYGGLARVTIGIGDDRKYGIIDTLGNEIVKPEYRYIRYPDNYIAVWQEKCGLINLKNQVVIPLVYDDIFRCWDNFFYVKKGDKAGIADSTGKFILPIIYDNIRRCLDKTNLIYSLNKKIGIMSKTGKIIVKPIYDEIENIDTTTSIVRLNNKSGIIGKNGGLAVPLIYDKIDHLTTNLNIAMLDNKYGVIDNYGNLIVSLKYDKIIPFKTSEPFFEHYNGIIHAFISGHDYSIDLYGNENPDPRYSGLFY